MNYIITETNGVRKYWSMYGGGFTLIEGEAIKFSDDAAERRLAKIHELAKNPQYKHWQGARIVSVEEMALVKF